MKMDSHSNKVLVTGADGFTGQYLLATLKEKGCEVVSLDADLTDRVAVFDEVKEHSPDYVIHLAAVSFVGEGDWSKIYDVNVVGTINLLDSLLNCKKAFKNVLLASSATVYGNVDNEVLSEDICPKPINHYGCSKLTMELMAQNYIKKLPIVLTRPFNYTGIGHAEHFLIPKIVRAYAERKTCIELGNLNVFREFNDVRDVVNIYLSLLSKKTDENIVNVCSGRTVSLMQIIDFMDEIAGYKIEVSVNPKFVRKDEIIYLSGDVSKLNKLVQVEFKFNIKTTLEWMYKGLLK